MSVIYLVVENKVDDYEICDGSYPLCCFTNILIAQHYCAELNIETVIQLVKNDELSYFIGTNFDKKLAATLEKIGYGINYHNNGIHWHIDNTPGGIDISKDQAIDILKNLHIVWYEVVILQNNINELYKHHLSR